MNITSEMKMADVIHLCYPLLPVISRFGINLGFGDKSVAEVCLENNINSDFFLEITNSFADEDYIPQKDLNSFSIKLIVTYLKKTHQYYLEEKVPEIARMITEMAAGYKKDPAKASLINSFFKEYCDQLNQHIEREETKIQPYVLEIESAYLAGKANPGLIKKIEKYSILDFADEHDNVEEKLNDLKNIIIKYLPPCNNSSLTNRILTELFRLEKDLNAHANLEDKVLIPKVAAMEKALITLQSNQ
jgi:regulator of cell morphogenesis and NO signaling